MQAAAECGANLVLFPELCISGYITAPIDHQLTEPVPGPSTEKMIALAETNGLFITFGLIEKAKDHFYCSHVVVSGDGVIGFQRTIHVPTHEQAYWQSGDAIEVFDIGIIKVGITVCRGSFFDEMTRTLYFRGAELVLMSFSYYNIPRSKDLKETIHRTSLVKACWTNGYYALVYNSAGERPPNQWEPEGRKFPGWAGVIGPWGQKICFVEEQGNDEAMVIAELNLAEFADRRSHTNFFADELQPALYTIMRGKT